MKGFLNFWIVCCVAGTAYIAVLPSLEVDTLMLQLSSAAQAQSISLSIALPIPATIHLPDSATRRGQIINIDPKQRRLLLQGIGERPTQEVINTNQVERISFSHSSPAYDGQGGVIRGDETRMSGQSMTLGTVPLSSFAITNAGRGRAVVTLSSASNIESGVEYVVDEIRFDEQHRYLTIVATPYYKP